MNTTITALAATVTTADAERLAFEAYGLRVTAKALSGEYDLNFHLRSEAGGEFILKVMRPGFDRAEVEMQHAMLEHAAQYAAQRDAGLRLPEVIAAQDGSGLLEVPAPGGTRLVRLLTFLPGRTLAHVTPHTPELLESLGEAVARLDAALAGFAHGLGDRPFKWNLMQASILRPMTALIDDPQRRALVERLFDAFAALEPRLHHLPQGTIHNDANDHNVVVEGHGYGARVASLVDFGDAVRAPYVCGLAIALAYALLGKTDPIAAAASVVRGYHRQRPLQDAELEVLYALVRTRLAVSVANSANEKRLRPDDAYAVISEAPAWALLEQLEAIPEGYALATLRDACGLEPVPNATRVRAWLERHGARAAPVLGHDLARTPVRVLDLSVHSLRLGRADETDTSEKLERHLFAEMREHGSEIGIGRYCEPRLVYTAPFFATPGEDGPEYRSVHIGMDAFMAALSPVHAPLAGTVHSFADNSAALDYGPCIVLEHTVDDDRGPLTFHTLYGHLSRESLEGLQVGQTLEAGAAFATLGDASVNGGWPPHLHFQVITDLLGFSGTYPGVARARDLRVWQSLSPDPNLILRVPLEHFPPAPMPGPAILAERRQRIGRNLSISYRNPVTAVRGHAQYLYSEHGEKFLDCYNNVPHVGHSHPAVVRAAQAQMAALNTNTRYLHENLVKYAAALTAKLPAPLSVCYFTSSGSEANELALRLARAHTGGRDLIVGDHAYHGHTNTLIDISPYKAEGPGGTGLPDWVHKAPVPDDYRGLYRRGEADVGLRYARTLEPLIERVRESGRPLSGFILETLPSVAGQIVPPDGYLRGAYERVRAAGGLCIADEVQTGFGRIGSHFWAFEAQGVVPDIVVLGKPIGNGHPLGAVITTPEIAGSFDNGMEFFATFGGNPVSTAVGLAVLEVMEAEGLQAHALEVGDRLMRGLRELAARHEIIGDVRGLGLFGGIELVDDRDRRTPAGAQAGYVVNRLRDHRILCGTDGPDHNVIKLRGPMCVSHDDMDGFLDVLEKVLREDAAQPAPA